MEYYKLRILIGVREIAGMATGLGEGFHSLGSHVAVLDLNGSSFSHTRRADVFNPAWATCLNRLARKTKRRSTGFLGRAIHCTYRTVSGLLALCIGVARYDQFIFLFGFSFLPWNLDLLLLKLLRKKTLMIFCGSDSRPGYLIGPWLRHQTALRGGFPSAAIAKLNRSQLAQLNRVSKWASVVVDHPLSAHLQPAPFISWLWAGLPASLQEPRTPLPEGKIRFLHAPSNTDAKGTNVIRAVMKELRTLGFEFEYEEVIGQPNKEVLAAIRRSHIVVDELYSDIGLAALGCESAAQGRVVVVGGYGWDYLKKYSPPGLSFPSIQVNLGTLSESLQRLLHMPRSELQLLADAHFAFVRDNWNAVKVAERYAAALHGLVPKSGWFDPRDIEYPWGAGSNREEVREAVRQTARCFGEAFLVPAARTLLREMEGPGGLKPGTALERTS